MFLRRLSIISLLIPTVALADVKENVREIQTRLDGTLALYRQNKAEDARSTIQKAYFEIFENLEGPIRINHSARKSFEMESAFWEIRKMMGESKPIVEVEKAIKALKNELTAVLPALENGHRLSAEGQHGAYENQEILPYWKTHFKIIDDLLAQAIESYQAGDFTKAKKQIQQAQYDGYKNSEMEIAIRQNRSAAISADINQQFYDLIKLSEQKDQLTSLGYQTTNLLQTIEEQLPQLPATREAQNERPKAETGKAEAKDWQQIGENIMQGLEQSISFKQQNETPKALFALKIAYFEQFEESGMSDALNRKDPKFKKAVDDRFNRLFGLMHSEKASPEELKAMQEQAVELGENFAIINKLLK